MWNLCKGKMICEADMVEMGLDGGEDFTREDGFDMGDLDGLEAQESDGRGRIRKKAGTSGHGGCGHRQPVIRKEGLKLVASMKDQEGGGATGEGRVTLSGEKVLAILKKISDADIVALGFHPLYSRPEMMLITVVPVPPPPVRPAIMMDATMRGEDDLTHKLADILKANMALRKHEQDGSPGHIVAEFEALLQFHVATYMDNDLPGIPQALQKSGRPLKSLRARLKGKEGRLRGNLMGKRVDFSARTVITPDPNLSLDEVGVPRSVAMTLTVPEAVTPLNMTRLTQLVQNGSMEYPGARYVIREDGTRISLALGGPAARNTPLQPGYVVERHLQDGDPVLFNRQPSLHKMSMMGHRVRVMPYSTFRLNLSVTTPYNADFDGDEMNLHAPQSLEARAELQELAAVPRQIISPQSNKPVMGIVQDSLLGIRKMTRRDVLLTREQVMNLVLWVPGWSGPDPSMGASTGPHPLQGQLPIPAILKPVPRWTGKQILSMVLPRVNLLAYHSAHPDGEVNNECSPGDTRVWIEDGQLLTGILCKRTVGNTSGGLVHVILQEHGPAAATAFFNGVQRVVNQWLLSHGFSIGIGDTVADVRTMATITSAISKAKRRVQEIIQESQHAPGLTCLPGMTRRETFERLVTNELDRARNTSGKSAQSSLKEQNNVKQMVVAGSKGNAINISQMTACVGQQSVEGRRIPFGFKHRTLPHFTKHDDGPESRGFVENSYLRGLTPQEFFFHAMGGREGLIDTAVKTAETGYIQRRLVKALEDVAVQYDGTVRNAVGDIIQFLYGDDGMDATFLEKQALEGGRLSPSAFEARFKLDLAALPGRARPEDIWDRGVADEVARQTPAIQVALDREWRTLLADREALLKPPSHGASKRTPLLDPLSMDTSRPLPVHVRRLIWTIRNKLHVDPRQPTDLSPMYVIQGVSDLMLRLQAALCPGDPRSSQQDSVAGHALTLFGIHVRSMLAVKRVLFEYRLTRAAFDAILGEIEVRTLRAMVAPGEMVGTIAAQSIGEPATQMTLNTFHLAGVASSMMNHGVPRLKEIINVAKKMKTPGLSVYLKDDLGKKAETAKTVQVALEHTTLRAMTLATEIHYDPDPSRTVLPDCIHC